MNRELLFFDKNNFYAYKNSQLEKGYEIVSISDLIRNLNNKNEVLPEYNISNKIFDISVLPTLYNEHLQGIGEQIFSNIRDTNTSFISDIKNKELFRYEFRYIFDEFNDITLGHDINISKSKFNSVMQSRHRKIIDLSEDELCTFFRNFRNNLYGHEKFKDDFVSLIENFRVFNRIGENKVLSLFLMGESGVGKTEVARILYNCLGGMKKLAKVNFGNYSSEFSLSSLIGSARGYIGSEDGEIFMRVRDTDVGVILIDEFEKSNATLFNYFLDVLESGKIISSLAEEIDLNGFIIIFTSNISKDNFKEKISPELRSRFDYKGMFTLLHENDKRKYVEFRLKRIIEKYNQEFELKLDDNIYDKIIARIDVEKYHNMRDLNKKIKMLFVKVISENREKV